MKPKKRKKHPRERKILALSEGITSKRFQKAQDRPKNVTLLSELRSYAPDSGVSSLLPAPPAQQSWVGLVATSEMGARATRSGELTGRRKREGRRREGGCTQQEVW